MSADTIVTWIGLALAIAGIGIALWQLQKTRSAAEAARDAVEKSEARIATNLLLSALPRLLDLELQLKSALARQEIQDADRILTQWRHAAGEAEALLRRNRPQSADLADLLVEAIAVLSQSDDVLEGGLSPSLRETIRVLARATSRASGELGAMQAYSGHDGDDGSE